MIMALKQVKLPKQYDHFPKYLDIRGKPWSRWIITGVYYQAKYEEEKINSYGLYKAIVVKKDYSTGPVYGVYMRAKRPRKAK